MNAEKSLIKPDSTLLNIAAKHRETVEVFRRYDAQAGECIMCQALFDTLEQAAARYGLDLAALTAELEEAIEKKDQETPL